MKNDGNSRLGAENSGFEYALSKSGQRPEKFKNDRNSRLGAESSGFAYGLSESGQRPVTLENDGNSRIGAESSANAQAGGQEQYRDYGSKSFFAPQGAAGVRGQYQGSGHKESSAYHDKPRGQNSEEHQGFRPKEISVNRGDAADQQQQQPYSASSNSFAVNRGEGQEQNQEYERKQFLAHHSNDAGLGGYQNLGSQKSHSYYGGGEGHGQTVGSGQQDISSYRGSTGGYGQVQASGSQASSEYSNNAGQEQSLTSNYGHDGHRRRSGFGRHGASEQGNEQSALGGALDLASQGLKTAEGAQDGCSTCGKNSYAISNARSHSGSAVALSVGG